MTPTQPGDGAVNITVDSTDQTTDGQRNVQVRIAAFQREHDLAKRELLLVKQEFEVMALKLAVYSKLLRRVLDADANCTGEAYAALIEDIRAAMEVQSGA